ncbi:MAG: hypothetical protein L6R43_02925 [Planctomycetes bacterium]|nr:hypothetical protein [Planctomycetota bacterium]
MTTRLQDRASSGVVWALFAASGVAALFTIGLLLTSVCTRAFKSPAPGDIWVVSASVPGSDVMGAKGVWVVVDSVDPEYNAIRCSYPLTGWDRIEHLTVADFKRQFSPLQPSHWPALLFGGALAVGLFVMARRMSSSSGGRSDVPEVRGEVPSAGPTGTVACLLRSSPSTWATVVAGLLLMLPCIVPSAFAVDRNGTAHAAMFWEQYSGTSSPFLWRVLTAGLGLALWASLVIGRVLSLRTGNLLRLIAFAALVLHAVLASGRAEGEQGLGSILARSGWGLVVLATMFSTIGIPLPGLPTWTGLLAGALVAGGSLVMAFTLSGPWPQIAYYAVQVLLLFVMSLSIGQWAASTAPGSPWRRLTLNSQLLWAAMLGAMSVWALLGAYLLRTAGTDWLMSQNWGNRSTALDIAIDTLPIATRLWAALACLWIGTSASSRALPGTDRVPETEALPGASEVPLGAQ